MGSPSLLTTLLLLLAGVLIARLSAGRLARWAIPAILLELLVGVLLGNTLLPYAAIGPLSGLTELGVLTLFFQVGLEVRGDLLASRRGAILRTVALSALVPLLAYAPVRATYGLTSGATFLMLAALSATGTGVTLRLLAQRGALGTPSGRLLVGVSVLDDLPAIALLTVSTLTGGAASARGGLAWLGLPLGLGAAAVSWWASGLWMHRRSERPQNPLALLILLISCAWVGEVSGLSSLLGALWAGVLLSRLRGAEGNHPAHDEGVQGTFQVLTDVFLPLYFISVGMRLPLAALLEPRAWTLAAGLIALAMLSKAVCALGIWRQDVSAGVDRAVVVFGLIPRGLPGLVFATTARQAGVINPVEFSAVVLMVTFTTVVGLLLLDRRLAKVAYGEPQTGQQKSS
ncbi:MAG: cation:proton antiporter [Cyanobacteriota bacterium]|jgi:Kef-type K+ transport system membrane component KefB|nr:cation:proton antiporter [Cyanobacteriota bacterium]